MHWLRSVLCIGTLTGLGSGAAWIAPAVAQDRPVSSAHDAMDVITLAAHLSTPSVHAIELAWLADPITFPYPLRAVHQDNKLLIQGLVPTRGIQMKALAIATELSLVEVVDQVRVQPNMRVVLPEAPRETFALECRARLEQVGLPVRKQIELRATKDGRLIITGFADSEDDKLAYSRCFVGLAGCRSIRNEMVVGKAPRQALPHADVKDLETLPPPKPAPMPPTLAPGSGQRSEIQQISYPSNEPEVQKRPMNPWPKLLAPVPAREGKTRPLPTPALLQFHD